APAPDGVPQVLPSRVVRGSHTLALGDLSAGGSALRRHAADVSATPHFDGRLNRSHHLVSPPIHQSRCDQPTPKSAHRLEMVRGVAGWLWRRGRTCCGATGARADPSTPLRTSGRHQNPGNHGGKKRKERPAMSLGYSRSHFWPAAAAIVFLLAVAACNNLP